MSRTNYVYVYTYTAYPNKYLLHYVYLLLSLLQVLHMTSASDFTTQKTDEAPETNFTFEPSKEVCSKVCSNVSSKVSSKVVPSEEVSSSWAVVEGGL